MSVSEPTDPTQAFQEGRLSEVTAERDHLKAEVERVTRQWALGAATTRRLLNELWDRKLQIRAMKRIVNAADTADQYLRSLGVDILSAPEAELLAAVAEYRKAKRADSRADETPKPEKDDHWCNPSQRVMPYSEEDCFTCRCRK